MPRRVRNVPLPDSRPETPELQALFYRACYLAEHFANTAWCLAGDPTPPTDEERARAGAGDVEADMHVWAYELASQERVGEAAIEELRAEVDETWARLSRRSDAIKHLAIDALINALERLAADPNQSAEARARSLDRYLSTFADVLPVSPGEFDGLAEDWTANDKKWEALADLLGVEDAESLARAHRRRRGVDP